MYIYICVCIFICMCIYIYMYMYVSCSAIQHRYGDKPPKQHKQHFVLCLAISQTMHRPLDKKYVLSRTTTTCRLDLPDDALIQAIRDNCNGWRQLATIAGCNGYSRRHGGRQTNGEQSGRACDNMTGRRPLQRRKTKRMVLHTTSCSPDMCVREPVS